MVLGADTAVLIVVLEVAKLTDAVRWDDSTLQHLTSPEVGLGAGKAHAVHCAVQGDSTQQHVKSLDVVLGAETAVLIVDDTAAVWPLHAANLLQVWTCCTPAPPDLGCDRLPRCGLLA